MSEFIISYDIKNQKRLAKFSRKVEKIGVRIQYSVFFIRLTKEEMAELALELSEIIDSNEDDVRIYEIEDYGISLGCATNLEKIFIIR